MNWQPIETAPNERGAKILGWCVFPAGAEVRFCENRRPFVGSKEAVWEAYGLPQKVTHWMPLPPPPEQESA